MSILYIVAAIAFCLWAIRNTLFWVSLWQIKEYRLDRLFVHLKETNQGRSLLIAPLSLLKWVGIFFYIVTVFNPRFFLPYQVFVSGLFLVQAFLTVREFSLGFFKRPAFTIKAIAIVFLVLLTLFFSLTLPLLEEFLWLLILDRILPLIVSFFVFLFSFPSELYRDVQIGNAIKKINKRKNLLVIGVTGSYGKSSTKDIIAQVLRRKFRVLKTRGTNNTPIGVANTILSDLKGSTQIFVVEMGAYKKGEIAQLCKIARPKVGVLTGINDQHLSLFGSLENTKKTKYELIESLPKDGLALFNGNNEYVLDLYKKTKKKKILYVCSDPHTKAGISANNVSMQKTSVEFSLRLRSKTFRFTTPLIGSHNIENILPAVYIAHFLGMKMPEIKKAVAALTGLPKTMARHEVGGVTIIDDTFNTNPQAVLAVLDYMRVYRKKKIMVFTPMIELGQKAKEEHYVIGKEIAIICNILFLTNKNYYEQIRKGVKDGSGKCRIVVAGISDIAQFVNDKTEKGDIVVFEGKEAGLVIEKIL